MPFHAFTLEHGLTTLVGAGLIAGLIRLGRSGMMGRNVAAAILAFANLISYPLNLIAWMSIGTPVALDNLLPLHLCDIAAFLAAFALFTGHSGLRTLTYFWGLAFTLQALITPSIVRGFPHLPYFSFFIQHYAVVATAVFLPAVDGWRPCRPVWRSPLLAFRWGCVYMVFALGINALMGTNFGFVSHPPHTPSLIDHLGPWPVYLFSLLAISMAIFIVLAIPLCRPTPAERENCGHSPT